MTKRKIKKKSRGTIYTVIILIFLLGVTIFTVLPSTVKDTKPTSYGQEREPIAFTPVPPKSNLQLYTFTFPTVAPTPIPLIPPVITPIAQPNQPEPACGIANPILQRGNENGKCCVQDGPVNNPNECCSGVPYCDLTKNPPVCSPGLTFKCDNTKSTDVHTNAQELCVSGGSYPYWCNAKPVIYLYPKTKTTVNVSVKVPGTIPVSIPTYPSGGWRNIEAYPDGSFIYQGKTYHELFYESNVTPITPPDSGIVVSAANLQSSLQEITTKLGLAENEQQEFLAYWIPRLGALNAPYILISVFSQESKDIIDVVDITPKPDTFIQFIMYYKGLQNPVFIKPLSLPASIPARTGFTAVEWGGIIDGTVKEE